MGSARLPRKLRAAWGSPTLHCWCLCPCGPAATFPSSDASEPEQGPPHWNGNKSGVCTGRSQLGEVAAGVDQLQAVRVSLKVQAQATLSCQVVEGDAYGEPW